MTSVLKQYKKIQRLELSGLCSDLTELTAVLRTGRLSTITDLHLPLNTVGPNGISRLATALHECPRLSLLDLTCNYANDWGSCSLFNAFAAEACPQLTRLRFANNNMGAAGALSLSQVREGRAGETETHTERERER